MARGQDTGPHPGRQVGRGRYSPAASAEYDEDNEGPPNDDWINRGYWNMSKPNPNYRGKPGGS